ncbi:hypothetical protein [Halorhabdus amylolytica]|nr:hypothetical protein [Halorhabdus amylolytica]
MDRDEITEYVNRCQQLIESSPQMDEENTKVKLVQPFLELLGWDLYSTEVALEYTIPMASGSTHVDYALLVGDSPVVFVEAKPVRSTLTDDEIQQLRKVKEKAPPFRAGMNPTDDDTNHDDSTAGYSTLRNPHLQVGLPT